MLPHRDKNRFSTTKKLTHALGIGVEKSRAVAVACQHRVCATILISNCFDAVVGPKKRLNCFEFDNAPIRETFPFLDCNHTHPLKRFVLERRAGVLIILRPRELSVTAYAMTGSGASINASQLFFFAARTT